VDVVNVEEVDFYVPVSVLRLVAPKGLAAYFPLAHSYG